jgi:alkanesulfonate monooxygenase SsuD/methylene tetrahydromethanopterin reductase-like flavin-dependent oxidoreductase (luciferase family)
MPGIASAATAVVIGHIANATSTIRVGTGGIMLAIKPDSLDARRRSNVG